MQSVYHKYAHKAFFRMFPPPAMMLRPAVGIDVSDKAVRFVELLPRRKGYALGKFGEKILPPGAVAFGEIKDAASLKSVLISLRRDHGITFVHSSLPEEKAYMFRTEVPELSHEETLENIGFNLEEHVPLAIEDAYFDYEIVTPLFDKVASGMREAVVSVFPKSVVDSYKSAFEETGLSLLSFEMEDSALARALVRPDDMGTYMIADFGERRTGITIYAKGAVRFTTTIDIGGVIVTNVIAQNLNISKEEADKMKHDGSFARGGKYRELMPIIFDQLSPLTDQIEKHYVYWHNHPEKKEMTSPQIEKIILCGDGANLEGIAEHMAMTLRTDVVVGDVWQNAFSIDEVVPEIPKDKSLSYATAVGCALRGD